MRMNMKDGAVEEERSKYFGDATTQVRTLVGRNLKVQRRLEVQQLRNKRSKVRTSVCSYRVSG